MSCRRSGLVAVRSQRCAIVRRPSAICYTNGSGSSRAQTVGHSLRLPHRLLPVAPHCVGWPAQAGEITPRLSLRTTVIENRYGERDPANEIDAYDPAAGG